MKELALLGDFMLHKTNTQTVYFPDLPDLGRSQPIDGDYYIPELVEFVDNFSRKVGLESFHLMGHSLGGGIALSYVLIFPRKVKKLVLVSSMCLGREISWWIRFLSCSVLIRSIGLLVISILRGVKWVADKLFAGLEFVLPLSKASIQTKFYSTWVIAGMTYSNYATRV